MRDTFGRKVLTSAQRAAGKVFRTEETVKARTEHQKAQDAFNANRERLQAERLVREAGEATPAAEDKAKQG
jgi:hypothetical protein